MESCKIWDKQDRWDKTKARLRMTQIVSPANQLNERTSVPSRSNVETVEKRGIKALDDPDSPAKQLIKETSVIFRGNVMIRRRKG